MKGLRIWDSSQFLLLEQNVWNGREQIIQKRIVIIAETQMADSRVHGAMLPMTQWKPAIFLSANVFITLYNIFQ